MKRDWDLIREILLRIEAGTLPDLLPTDAVGYHLRLMKQAGMIGMDETPVAGRPDRVNAAVELTWTGHDWCDLVRDEARWRGNLSILQEVCGGAPADLLYRALATGELCDD